MFNWFWKLLFTLSQILYELIDACIMICNKICGIEPILVAGKETNFLANFLTNQRVLLTFFAAGGIGIFLLMVFSTIAICRNMKDGKKSNSEIAGQVFKTCGIFLIVPALMIGFTLVFNQIIQIMYGAINGDQEISIGKFLFKSFCPSGLVEVGEPLGFDYRDVNRVKEYLSMNGGYSLSDYRFFFSWIICIPLLFLIAKSLLMFVDRTLSIIILFIFSPISMSTSVLDDGARFKIWRDKIITKFVAGLGLIIGINVYIIVLAFITRSDVVFFPGGGVIAKFCDFILKCAFALGGAFFLPKVFGLVGDLFTNGGGEREIQGHQSAWRDLKQQIFEYRRRSNERQGKEQRNKQQEAQSAALLAAGATGGASLAASQSGNQNVNISSNNLSLGGAVKSAIQGGVDLGKNSAKQANKIENKQNVNNDSNRFDKKPQGSETVKNKIMNINNNNNK